jgi:hypothetical protein
LEETRLLNPAKKMTMKKRTRESIHKVAFPRRKRDALVEKNTGTRMLVPDWWHSLAVVEARPR